METWYNSAHNRKAEKVPGGGKGKKKMEETGGRFKRSIEHGERVPEGEGRVSLLPSCHLVPSNIGHFCLYNLKKYTQGCWTIVEEAFQKKCGRWGLG